MCLAFFLIFLSSPPLKHHDFFKAENKAICPMFFCVMTNDRYPSVTESKIFDKNAYRVYIIKGPRVFAVVFFCATLPLMSACIPATEEILSDT